jgi:hypothetical protein
MTTSCCVGCSPRRAPSANDLPFMPSLTLSAVPTTWRPLAIRFIGCVIVFLAIGAAAVVLGTLWRRLHHDPAAGCPAPARAGDDGRLGPAPQRVASPGLGRSGRQSGRGAPKCSLSLVTRQLPAAQRWQGVVPLHIQIPPLRAGRGSSGTPSVVAPTTQYTGAWRPPGARGLQCATPVEGPRPGKTMDTGSCPRPPTFTLMTDGPTTGTEGAALAVLASGGTTNPWIFVTRAGQPFTDEARSPQFLPLASWPAPSGCVEGQAA